MSLVKCPECGRSISSAANSCPHCGCVVTVCPDCGAVYAGNKAVCENCGCKLQTETGVTGSVKKPSGESDKTLARLKQAEIVQILIIIFYVVAAVIAAVCAFIVFDKGLTYAKTTENVYRIKSECDQMRSLILTAAIFGCLSGLYIFLSVVERHIFACSVRDGRETYKTYLLSEKKKKTTLHFVVEFLELPERTVRKYVLAVLPFLLESLGFILLGVWATGVVNDFWFRWMLASGTGSVRMIWNFKDVAFIFGAVFLVAGYVLGLVFNRTCYSEECYNNIRSELGRQK